MMMMIIINKKGDINNTNTLLNKKRQIFEIRERVNYIFIKWGRENFIK